MNTNLLFINKLRCSRSSYVNSIKLVDHFVNYPLVQPGTFLDGFGLLT